MHKSVLKDILAKAVERLGSRQLWQISHVVRAAQEEANGEHGASQPCPDSHTVASQEHEENASRRIPAECLRAALREIDLFISDSHFDTLCASCSPPVTSSASASSAPPPPASLCPCSGERCIDVDLFLHALIEAALNPRRQHVVRIVLSRVDPEGSAVVSAEALLEAYDVRRHPQVVNGMRDAASVRQDFAAHLHLTCDGHEQSAGAERSNRRGAITAEELLFYFAGISLVTPSDTDFELFCARAFSLDNPRSVNAAQAAAAAARFPPSAHPLYKTTNADYGKELVRRGAAAYSRAKYGLSQKFSKNLSTRLGGATSMNT